MPIVPTGAPAWARTVTIEDFGGSTDKRNFLDRSPIDSLTDVGAEQFARMTNDLASVTRTAPFAIITLRYWLSRPPTFEFVHMMTGVRLTSYEGDSSPTGYPSAVRNGDADFTLTFASSYRDEFGVAADFAVRHVLPQAIGTVVRRAIASIPTPTTVRVKVFEADDSAVIPGSDGERVSLLVW